MTSYRVITTKRAKDQLIEIWLSASDRSAVTQAQHRIETTLSHSPRHPGRELSEGLWRIAVQPLVAYYSIDDARAVVKIADIKFLR